MASVISEANDTVSATGGSARSQADDRDERQWRPRRGVGALVRLVSYALPILVAAVVVRLAETIVARPRGTLALTAWLVALAILATVTVRIVDHASRKLLPLSALLRLSLVFPDHAPSRFALALRSGSGRALQRAVDSASTVDEFPAPQEAAETLVTLVASLSRHDRLTRGHSERVRAYADLIGRELHLDDDARVKLHWAALVHDVGKLDVPREILQKRGRPSDDEWAVLRGHPAASERYLAALAEWLGEWVRAASEHHERVDGTGYPRGLKGEEISVAGRIVAVADAFDVMTSARSYKKPFPAAAARAELAENAGTQFDPEVVRAFLSVSLRDLSLVVGPLAIVTQLPALAQVPLEAASATLAPVVAGVAAAGLAFVAPGHLAASGPSAAKTAANGGSGSASSHAPGRGAPVLRTPDGHAPTTTAVSGRRGIVTVTTRPGSTGTTAPPRGGPAPTPTSRPPSPTTPRSTAPTTVGVNHAPVAHKDTKGKIQTPTGTVDVLANDSDADGNLDPSTLTIVRLPNGKPVSLSVSGGQVHFSLTQPSYKGNATFRYQICDTEGACAQAEVTLSFD